MVAGRCRIFCQRDAMALLRYGMHNVFWDRPGNPRSRGASGSRATRPTAWAARLSAPLENRIPLLAGLDDFPDSFESGRHDERVACPKFVPLARDRFNANAALDEHAELVLGVTYSPLAAGAGP